MADELKCRECGGRYDPEWFQSHTKNDGTIVFDLDCLLCAQSKRDNTDPFYRKAYDATRRHAEKYKMPMKEFQEEYGWDVKKIAHEMKHAWENGCGDCDEPYQGMENGLRELTLDILDPTKEPYYRTNVRIICNGCNQRKSSMSPERYERFIKYGKKWKRNQTVKRENPKDVQLEWWRDDEQAA